MPGIVWSMAGVVGILCSVVGTMVSVVSLGLFGVWVGMEFSFMSSLCFVSGSSVEEVESVMKYYVVQVLGSMVWSMGVLVVINYMLASFGEFFILVGLFIKLGVFPFHFWVAPVVSKLSWVGCAGILFLQKISPLWVMGNYVYLSSEMNRVEVLCCLTCLVGCLGGLNVLNYRVLIGFSSIQNLGVMVLLSCCADFELLLFIVIYFVLMGSLMFSLSSLKVSSFQDLLKESEFEDYSNLWWVSIFFMSSAGMPPFLGCSLKLLLLISCWEMMPFGVSFCLMTSSVSLVFYLSVVVSLVMYWGKVMFLKGGSNKSSGGLKVISLLVNLVGGFLVFLVVSL